MFPCEQPKTRIIELDIDSTGFSPYVRGGIATQVKESKDVAFKSLRDALADPGEFLMSDFSKFDRPPLLHLGFQALDAFAVCHPQYCSCILGGLINCMQNGLMDVEMGMIL